MLLAVAEHSGSASDKATVVNRKKFRLAFLAALIGRVGSPRVLGRGAERVRGPGFRGHSAQLERKAAWLWGGGGGIHVLMDFLRGCNHRTPRRVQCHWRALTLPARAPIHGFPRGLSVQTNLNTKHDSLGSSAGFSH